MAVASTTGAVSGILLFTAAAGVTGSWQWAIPLGIVGAALIGLYIWRKRLLPVDERACSRALLSVGAVSGIVLLVQLARLAVFMVNPSQAGYSTIPTSRWEVRHSCLSAYYVAANAAEEGADVYADALYSLPGNPTALRRPRTLGAFNIDVYEYPPPFLLLPRAAQYVASDFIRLRAFWFAFNAALVVIALLAISRSLEPGAASRALLLSPLVLLALPTLGALQKGNVQLIVVAVSMVAMLCFQRGRFAIGGAMLGFAIVSKLYPGLLIIYLLLRREWRPVLWTAAMAALFAVVALIDTGWAPYAAFLEHFLKLMSGEAFPAFRNPAAVASNMSIPGLVFKLKPLGIADLSFGAAKIVGCGLRMARNSDRCDAAEPVPPAGIRSVPGGLAPYAAGRGRRPDWQNTHRAYRHVAAVPPVPAARLADRRAPADCHRVRAADRDDRSGGDGAAELPQLDLLESGREKLNDGERDEVGAGREDEQRHVPSLRDDDAGDRGQERAPHPAEHPSDTGDRTDRPLREHVRDRRKEVCAPTLMCGRREGDQRDGDEQARRH
jgi:hypothetical protein